MSIRKPTIYIAGPMRGITDYNFPQFDSRAVQLEQEGWAVINPAELDRQAGTPDTCPHKFNPCANEQDQECMRTALARDLRSICKECTDIFMLSGWEDSKGAKAEHTTALALGLKIHYETQK